MVIIGGGWAAWGAAMMASCESVIKDTEILLMDAMSDLMGVRSVFSINRYFLY